MLRTGLLLLASLSSPFLGACATVVPERRPPNVVLIVADDLGWAELGCYGQTKIRTPRIDALAREGARFTQFYAGAPVCAPSRCTLLTGKHNGHGFVRDNHEMQPEGQLALPASEVTIAEALRANGYATGCFGKWGLSTPDSEGHPNAQGFDQFFGYICQRQAHDYYPDHLWRNGERVELDGKQYSHDLVAEAALDFVRRNKEQPFFLYVPFTIPHLALQVPEDSLADYAGRWEDPPYDGKKGYRAHATPRAAYAAMVTRMDRDVGRLVDLLEQLDLDENTVVLFTSDNGPTYDRIGGSDSKFFESAGGLRGLKGSVYEGGLRVPLVVRWPGAVKPGTKCENPAAFWDLFPTLCEATGAAAPAGLDGESLVRALVPAQSLQVEPVYERTKPLYWELAGYGGQQAARKGDWKAVRREMKQGNERIELYDLRNDPGEARDVALAHPGLVDEFRLLFETERTESKLFPLRKR
ncbi:MAG: arylsulfatase [Planctomycetaceae bacterium]|nr:arylsulfatase [Planctomycetaceae bacterium]